MRDALLPWLGPMLLLIFLSAFFSAAEAALFSLRTRDRRALERGPIGGRIAVQLLEKPERLLSTVLFWNLLVNITYFAIASIVASRLQQSSPVMVAGFTMASVLVLIFFSEMLPKSIAVLSPRRISRIAGPPMVVATKILTPVLPIVAASNTLARRLLWPGFSAERELEVEDIERAIELGTGDAALAARERAALRQLVQLAAIRVDEWMIPRSHLKIHRGNVTSDILREEIPPLGYLLLAEAEAEEMIAAIPLRTLRPSQLDDLAAAREPILYVPWSSSVADTFESLRTENRQVAAVVNEYGDTIGVLTLDLILQGILRLHAGRPQDTSSEVLFEVAEDGVWRVSGMMSVRRLAEHLGVAPPESRNVTIAGLMQEENERLPRVGDTCRWDRFLLRVIESSGRGQVRIEIRDLPPEGGPT